LDAGGQVTGFPENRWQSVQEIAPGDYLLCYLAGISRWIGVLEATSAPFMDFTPIWKGESLPCRVRVRPIEWLSPETAVPLLDLRDRLSIFRDLHNPVAWNDCFQGAPIKWPSYDGEVVLDAVVDAGRNPVFRPVHPYGLTLRRRDRASPIGLPFFKQEPPFAVHERPQANKSGDHTDLQWLLLKLGSDMGLDVWVARNDRGREADGNRFKDLPNLKPELPLQFDEATTRTIEHIDVLWLKGNAIVAAFEVESTTSIYSGLLRMSDLIAMQPNLNIPLYLVAPDERRDKVMTEVNRQTFSSLTPPLVEVCRYIPFSILRERLKELGSVTRYLKPEFLEEISESCKGGDKTSSVA
jgi:hypothetical protein